MHILVLDTIHGGKAIGEAFAARGDHVDCVDVYRGESKPDVTTAQARNYDLIVAPAGTSFTWTPMTPSFLIATA